MHEMGIKKVTNIDNIFKSNEKHKKSSQKTLTLIENKKKHARLIFQMASSICYGFFLSEHI